MGVEVLLSLQLLSLRFAYLVDLETRTHSAVHYYLARSLNFLKTVQRDVVEIGSGIQVPLLVPKHLFKEDISASLPLLSLQKKIVGGGDLIVFVVLNVSHRLIQITVWTDAGGGETILNFREVFFKNRYSILANYNTLQLARFYLLIPLVVSNVLNSESFSWIGVQNLLDQVFAWLTNNAWNEIVAVKNFLIQLASIWVLERQVTTSHSV